MRRALVVLTCLAFAVTACADDDTTDTTEATDETTPDAPADNGTTDAGENGADGDAGGFIEFGGDRVALAGTTCGSVPDYDGEGGQWMGWTDDDEVDIEVRAQEIDGFLVTYIDRTSGEADAWETTGSIAIAAADTIEDTGEGVRGTNVMVVPRDSASTEWDDLAEPIDFEITC
ncbi:MAG: hypothetical protein JJU45_05070 [Acidimicrobiia bacterium]|nr:hypothetical protein [Acidimicrobiia bacterium]